MISLWIPIPILSSPSIALFGLVVLYGAITKKLSFQWNWILFNFIVLYLVYVLYCIPSKDLGHAAKDLEHKLSFVVFPILFSFKPHFNIHRKKLLSAFTIGCTILGLYFVSQAIYHYAVSGNTSYFHSSAFAPSHHPSYAAAFFSFSIFFLINEIIPSKNLKITSISIAIISFLTILHLPLESLSGILVLGFITATMMLRWAWKTFAKWIFASFLILGLISIQAIFWIQPSLKKNISYTASVVTHYLESPTKFIRERPNGMSGNQARLVIWTVSSQIIMDHPFGIGLGNLDKEMQQRLIRLHQDELVEKNYNPHNQFLQILAEIGLVGMLSFLFIMFLAIRHAWQRDDKLFLFLIFSLLVNCLVESMLQRQSGIVFYVQFMCLFASIIQQPKHRKLTQNIDQNLSDSHE
jgi:O-antigen ligase